MPRKTTPAKPSGEKLRLEVAAAQGAKPIRSQNHHLPNESQPGSNNVPLDEENPSSVWMPATDAGGQPPFKYSFSLSHKRIEEGGWTRQVTVRDLPISKKMAGVQMRLIIGSVRELHWHRGAEWALMLYGNARITAVNAEGRSHVSDVGQGDLWIFLGGIPHPIQGLGRMDAVFCSCLMTATSMNLRRFC